MAKNVQNETKFTSAYQTLFEHIKKGVYAYFNSLKGKTIIPVVGVLVILLVSIFFYVSNDITGLANSLTNVILRTHDLAT